jgi:hypothetical protein
VEMLARSTNFDAEIEAAAVRVVGETHGNCLPGLRKMRLK